jgi:hypothetical protein
MLPQYLTEEGIVPKERGFLNFEQSRRKFRVVVKESFLFFGKKP